MPDPRRGDIWTAIFRRDVQGREQQYPRPVLVVSSDFLNEIPESMVVVAPITRTVKDIPWHIPIPSDSVTGLDAPGAILLDQIRAAEHGRLEKRHGQAPQAVMERVKTELLSILDLEDL